MLRSASKPYSPLYPPSGKKAIFSENCLCLLYTSKALSSTGAIRKERVYLLSESLLQTPATRLAAAVYLASSMYPNLFGDVDATEAARQLIDEAGLPSAGTFFYP